jgi:dTDP-4-amino-4,6-dideoxygalactose transaminase
MSEPIPLSRPELGAREEELVLEVLRSGRLSLGPVLEEFERTFAAWLGVGDAVAVSSGTAALHLGVRGLGWGRGDEVVTSPFSFVASANCLLYEGARPVFCDVDPVTLDLDPEGAAAAVGERTVGLLPVHIFGWPAAMAELETLAAAHGLGVLEDACEALGATDAGGQRVGARGNPAAFAFYANKQMTTGEGGMLIPPDADFADRARSERNQGRAAEMEKVEHERLGFNYRLTDIAAAIGVAQLERLDSILEARARVAGWYGERLGGIDGLDLLAPERGSERRGWFVYPVLLPDGVDREGVIARLATAGIQSKAYMPCLHLFPFYRERFGYREGEFPGAERAAARNLALPFFTSMSERTVERVCDTLVAALARSKVRSSSTS